MRKFSQIKLQLFGHGTIKNVVYITGISIVMYLNKSCSWIPSFLKMFLSMLLLDLQGKARAQDSLESIQECMLRTGDYIWPLQIKWLQCLCLSYAKSLCVFFVSLLRLCGILQQARQRRTRRSGWMLLQEGVRSTLLDTYLHTLLWSVWSIKDIKMYLYLLWTITGDTSICHLEKLRFYLRIRRTALLPYIPDLKNPPPHHIHLPFHISWFIVHL